MSVTSRPTSSPTSRATACSKDSPGSTKPASTLKKPSAKARLRASSSSSPRRTSMITAGLRRGKLSRPHCGHSLARSRGASLGGRRAGTKARPALRSGNGSYEMAIGTLTYRSMVGTAARVCTWYIRHVDLFRGLTPRDADDLAHAMTVCRFEPGQLIVSPETLPEKVFLTRVGTVRMFHRETDGQETTVERLYSGHLFGVTGFLGTGAGGLP